MNRFAWIYAAILVGAANAMAANPGVPWPATDALGRSLPLADEVGPPRDGRFVGIFYFLWHHDRVTKSPQGDHPFDISKILAADAGALHKPDSPLWGPPGRAHYWGEPLFGYYLSDDVWVIRRHAQMLADAGVDTLIFDTTNAATYKPVYMKLCEVFTQIRKEGGHTPQIAFMVNTAAGATAEQIYHDLYEPILYSELWFRWQGKPLLICDPAAASPAVRAFFTLRRAHWPFTMENTKDAWHWEATYPQPFGYTDDPRKPEQVNVSVAQNLSATPDGRVVNMSSGAARGRGFHDGRQDGSATAIARGLNFAEQWKRAYELDPPFVMVTGWNEWIAGRFKRPGEPIAFVDQFDQEFSRDIEPVKGLHGDAFYYQLIDGIRRYKGTPPIPKASAPKTIRIDSAGFDAWSDVQPDFRDDVGDTASRDHDGAAGLHYTNTTGRNDLISMKVARDAENVYFYLHAREPLRGRQDGAALPAGLCLLIDTDHDPATGWEGYDYIVNRTGSATLEKHAGGGWAWTKESTPIDVRCNDATGELHLSIPRNAIGLANISAVSLDFKWTDNLQNPEDPMDFHLSGDVAPNGRMRYRFAGDPR